MKKYTIKEFAEGKKAVKIENEEQWNKLNKVYELTSQYHGVWEYGNKQGYSKTPNWYISNGWEVLEFSQLDFEDEFVVGSWYEFTNKGFQKGECYVKFVEKAGDIIWYSERIFGKTFTKNKDWCDVRCDLILLTDLSEIQPFLPSNHPDLIKKDTFVLSTMQEIKVGSQFKVSGESANTIYTFNRIEGDDVDVAWGIIHHVHYYLSTCLANIKDGSWILVNKEKTMEKEILGYKLIKPEYEKATIKLLGWNFTTKLLINISEKGDIHRLKEAGVLDLWFEPVFAPDKPKLPTINGKQCVDNGDKTITCGCTTKSFDWILGVDYAMGEEIDISGTKVSDKEIRQIVEYIKNNK